MNYENPDEELERGKYKPPVLPGEYNYAEIENKIFAALDADIRTLPRIKDHAGLERSFDLTPVIDGMVIDKKIRSKENGTITAFFRYGEMPLKFHLTGDGTVAATFDTAFKPRDETQIAEPTSTWRNPRKRFSKPDASPKARRGKPMIEIDEEQLEHAAATLANRAEIAKSLGIGIGTLDNRLKTFPVLYAALQRGREKYFDTGDVREVRGIGVPTIKDSIDLALLNQYAFENLTIAEASVKLGLKQGTLENYIYTPGKIRDAWLKGRGRIAGMAGKDDGPDLIRDAVILDEQEEKPANGRTEFYRKALGDVESDPRFAHTLDHLSQNGRSRDGIEAKKIEFLEQIIEDEPEFVPAPETNPGIIIHDARTQGHKKHVALSNGGHIVLGFDGGFFEASKKERELLNRLADLVQEFEERGE